MSNKPYWQQRAEMKLKGKKTTAEQKAEKKKIKGTWFENQIAQAYKVGKCENCGCSLRPTMAVNEAAVIAHLVSKTKAPSVAYVDLNRAFLCGQCHDAYDKASSEEIEKMKIYTIAMQRMQTFIHLIPVSEMRFVPNCYLVS